MKYAVIVVTNGIYSINSEWDEKNKAIVGFHNACMTLWNSDDVTKAAVQLVDEVFTVIKSEYIKYDN